MHHLSKGAEAPDYSVPDVAFLLHPATWAPPPPFIGVHPAQSTDQKLTGARRRGVSLYQVIRDFVQGST
jgi:hypothetical protein